MAMRTVLAAGAILVTSCTLSRTPPRVQAAAVDARCGDEPTGTDTRIVGSTNVDRVEPLYAIVDSTPNGMESRLIGAKLHVRTIDGVTAEALGHALQCHAARQTVQEPPAADACPYALPDGWVDIQVKADAMGYEVDLRGQDFVEARQILDRARAFASN
ncbi:MAG TPA: hypothetical protein VIF15_06260 [Polyangiaceae bacterium]|jgi:hypothetical protein